MRSHEIDYKIWGDDLQFVEVALDHGETVIAEAGAMMYIEEGYRVRNQTRATVPSRSREPGARLKSARQTGPGR